MNALDNTLEVSRTRVIRPESDATLAFVPGLRLYPAVLDAIPLLV